MKKPSTKFNKEITKIKLTASERVDLRDRVCTYMEYHPVANSSLKAGKSEKKATSNIFGEKFVSVRLFSWHYQKFVAMGVLVFAIVLPSMAERAVPGDMLYPMKVQVNEEVRSKLSFSSYAKVEWEADRLERRLAEARILEDEGKLTEEVEMEVAQAVKKHSDAAKIEIASIREDNEDDAALAEISFMSVLEAQNDIFTLQEDDNEAEEGTEDGVEVPPKSHALAKALMTAQADISSPTPAVVTEERMLALLERETTFAEELFRTIKEKASDAEKVDIERRLDDIERIVIASQAQTQTTDEAQDENATTTEPIQGESVAQLRQALINTRKLISFMTDIRLRSKVTVEELVPIELTNDEKKLNSEKLSVEVKKGLIKIESYQLAPENQEKMRVAVEEVKNLLEESERNRLSGQMEDAYIQAKQAKEIVDDLLVMIYDDESATSATPVIVETETVSATGTQSASTTATGTAPVAEETVEEGV